MSDKPGPDGIRPDEEDIQESLNRAIDTLEEMLSGRRGVSGGTATTPDPPEPAGAPEPLRGEQFTIPLLNDVVVPGSEPAPGGLAWTPHDGGPGLVTTPEMEIHRRLFERLASEIEIIIQTGVEEALEQGRKSIRKRISDHIEIVLPEILEEVAHLNNPKDR